MAGGFDGEVGVHFTTHVANHYSTPEMAELGRFAHDRGFDQIWVNDNLGYRNVFAVLTALASKTPVKIGTSIMVPYLRNPIDVADTVGAISELTNGQEVSIGIGRGSPHLAGSLLNVPNPYRMMRETVECLDRLFDGEEVQFSEYDLLTSYFNLRPEATMRLAFKPQSPVRFYIGGFGQTAMTVGGKFMDGTILSTALQPFLELGKVQNVLATANEAAAERSPGKKLKHVAIISTSLSDDREAARDYPKPFIAHAMVGSLRMLLSDEELETIDIDPRDIERIQAALDEGATIEEVTNLVTDEMVDGIFIAGRPGECLGQFRKLADDLAELGIDQMLFQHLGPDYEEAIDSLATDVVPAIRS